MQGTDVPWPHDVHIALPPSYEHGDRSYPVLWVTDASLSFALTLGLMNWLHTVQEIAELIVIGVGAPDESDPAEFGARRTHDFYPRPKWVNAGLGGARMEALSDETPTGGGADAFLSFLVDELRPRLASEFRFDDHHGLVGFSGGGHFVGFALLSRPAAFDRYLASSPALSGCEDLLFTLEAEYATTHDDLAAKVFLGAGEAELSDPYLAAADILGSMTRMAQLLRLRNYPSLELTSRLYPRQTHGSALPYALNEGLRTLYPLTTPRIG
ncbi:alpha/beta hydrolase [Streptomyces justiciae]|uniref:Alpha/beta hydrolase-fold protein n=1 Tax=Streptomyces justiciae TaxID=2780140 RepID=A0ABU3M8F9_9ACTN|nr:alpha/beta hydrolase-fold protein [Streptomyces justiciae]MDT7847806.1 alpha/beta hydrolase-fold protein [Streptomyces justiciae]